MLLTAFKPILDNSPPPVAKRVRLGIAFASNVGSTWLPISSPVNLIAVSLLDEFDHPVTLFAWTVTAIPVSLLVIAGSWICLMYLFPNVEQETTSRQSVEQEMMLAREQEVQLTTMHRCFLVLAVVAIFGITVLPDRLEFLIGHPACISLSIVVFAFGSGFMSRQEFVQLDWDLLALVGGTNVMAFLVRETGLGASLSAYVVRQEAFTTLPFWGMLAILVCGTLLVSSTVGHTLTGVILLPLVIALGVKLQAAEVTALLLTIAIPLGMAFQHSSFDNVAAQISSRLNRRTGSDSPALQQRDFVLSGGATAVWAAVVLLTLGFTTTVLLYGPPPPVVVAETGTPKTLAPKVVEENIPKEHAQVQWNDKMPDWAAFMKRPDKKAFAVSELEAGMATRAWAASWNHDTQEEANDAAMRDCQKIARKCRLIWPRKEFGGVTEDTKKYPLPVGRSWRDDDANDEQGGEPAGESANHDAGGNPAPASLLSAKHSSGSAARPFLTAHPSHRRDARARMRVSMHVGDLSTA